MMYYFTCYSEVLMYPSLHGVTCKTLNMISGNVVYSYMHGYKHKVVLIRNSDDSSGHIPRLLDGFITQTAVDTYLDS